MPGLVTSMLFLSMWIRVASIEARGEGILSTLDISVMSFIFINVWRVRIFAIDFHSTGSKEIIIKKSDGWEPVGVTPKM